SWVVAQTVALGRKGLPLRSEYTWNRTRIWFHIGEDTYVALLAQVPVFRHDALDQLSAEAI
ncbi:MAG: hypothetical protein NTZ81_10770, partial [Actinobacteria bacterium]|nr:hypothetical protein [Actinomycetota bacterium]